MSSDTARTRGWMRRSKGCGRSSCAASAPARRAPERLVPSHIGAPVVRSHIDLPEVRSHIVVMGMIGLRPVRRRLSCLGCEALDALTDAIGDSTVDEGRL